MKWKNPLRFLAFGHILMYTYMVWVDFYHFIIRHLGTMHQYKSAMPSSCVK